MCLILSFIWHMKYFQSEEASRDIEQFVAAQAREDARRQLTGGCRTVHSRTVINTRAGEEEERRRASEETKLLGNTAFRQGQFSRAEELYTSALLQYDKVTLTHSPHYLQTTYTLYFLQNYILFTNRAQARLKQGKYQDAVDDCKEAIKLKQDNLKTIIIITKALRGMKDYQKAMDMLELADKIPNVDKNIVAENRREIISEMKKFMKS